MAVFEALAVKLGDAVFGGLVEEGLGKAFPKVGKWLRGFNNHDIQKALHKAWKMAAQGIFDDYNKGQKRLSSDEQTAVKEHYQQLVNPETVDKIFTFTDDKDKLLTQADVGQLYVADWAQLNRQLMAELKKYPLWDALPPSWRDTLECSLLNRLRYYFLELGIKDKNKPESRDAVFFQQFIILRQQLGESEQALKDLMKDLDDQLRQDLAEIQARLGRMEGGIDHVKDGVNRVEGGLGHVKDGVDQLHGKVDELAKKAEQWAERFTVDASIDSELEETYLHWLLQTAGKVDLARFDPKMQDKENEAPLKLEAIYTALLTRSSDQKERDMTRESKPLSALAMLERHRHLVLLGGPGSGKSTFVNFVVVCLAGERLKNPQANLAKLTAPLPDRKGQDEKEAQPWAHGALLPVRVILREFAIQGLPAPGQEATLDHLWQFLDKSYRAKWPAYDLVTYLQSQLSKQGGLILLDGLDEVAEARRPQIKQVVQELVNAYHKCHILVTSRTYAYRSKDEQFSHNWRFPDFVETELDFFSEGQIRRFVHSWYLNVGARRRFQADFCTQRAKDLELSIFDQEKLADMAKRPILLTFMGILHMDGIALTTNRARLYESTVELLLDHWENYWAGTIKEEEADQYSSLSEWLRIKGIPGGKDRIRRVLNRLAYDVHMAQAELKGTANIEGEELSRRLLDYDSHDDNIKVKQLLKYLNQRAGILVLADTEKDNVFTFPHRTFQEYLAACHLTTERNFNKTMAELVWQDPNRWREVALLAGAKAADGVADNVWTLVRKLCPCVPPKEKGMLPAIVAAQHLVESADLTELDEEMDALVARVKAWLKYIMETTPSLDARERAEAGRILAQLGDDRPGVGLKDGLPDIEWSKTVKAGPFIMGSNQYSSEKPEHSVPIPYDYQISRYPITQAQYQAFVDDGGYTEKWRACWTGDGWQWREKEKRTAPRKYGLPFDLSNHPVVEVSWYEAVAFCNWLTARLAQTSEVFKTSEVLTIKLPSEAEWEKAARGTDGRTYPWEGNEADPDKANYDKTGIGATSAVGCFPGGASPCGAMDMAGNVWEWCSSAYKPYPYQADDGREDFTSHSDKVLRGGGWSNYGSDVRAMDRGRDVTDGRDINIGFRCVVRR